MSEKIIGRKKDTNGKTLFYVLPIETEQGFQDLIKFVSQEFECEFSELDKGPGTMVQKGVVDGKELVFVLSDSTGIQFFAEYEEDVSLAEMVAQSIEVRIREVEDQVSEQLQEDLP